MKHFIRFTLLVSLLATSLMPMLYPAIPAKAAGPTLNMVDNGVFDNVNSMSAAQIQSYLSVKNTTDFTNDLTCLASFQTPNFFWDGSYWHYGDLPANTTYGRTWSTAYGPATISAAQAVYQTAQFWGLNPQVILATLQKEEALPHGTSCATWRFNSAMGMNCPDSTLHDYPAINIFGTCVAQEKYAGYTRQLLWGSFQLIFSRMRSEGDGNLGWQGNGDVHYVGKETAGSRARYAGGPIEVNDGQVNLCNTSGGACQTWTIANGATASLLSYTPFYPQMFGYWLNEIISASGGSATCKTAGQSNVYRFYSQKFNNAHFFTTTIAERDALFIDSNWTYEGVAFCASPTALTGYAPIYRYYSPAYGNVHFFTANENEKTALAGDAHWLYEGVSFFEPTSSTTNPNAVPIARFWSPKFNNDHFFTGGSAETAALKNDPNWRFEAAAAWYGELPQ